MRGDVPVLLSRPHHGHIPPGDPEDVTQQNYRTICASIIYFLHHFAESLGDVNANTRLTEPRVVVTSQSQVTGDQDLSSPTGHVCQSVTCSATHTWNSVTCGFEVTLTWDVKCEGR